MNIKNCKQTNDETNMFHSNHNHEPVTSNNLHEQADQYAIIVVEASLDLSTHSSGCTCLIRSTPKSLKDLLHTQRYGRSMLRPLETVTSFHGGKFQNTYVFL